MFLDVKDVMNQILKFVLNVLMIPKVEAWLMEDANVAIHHMCITNMDFVIIAKHNILKVAFPALGDLAAKSV